jgi:hypothetical protein
MTHDRLLGSDEDGVSRESSMPGVRVKGSRDVTHGAIVEWERA